MIRATFMGMLIAAASLIVDPRRNTTLADPFLTL